MEIAATPLKFGIGAAVKRVEDDALVTGRGAFVDDVAVRRAARSGDGVLTAVVLRSTMAHARFTLGGVAEARALPGVAIVLTAEDIADLGPLPCDAAIPNADGSPLVVPPRPLLNLTTVRHVGDPIAFIAAETPDQAMAALEAIDVGYEALDACIGTATALDPDQPAVWPELGGNLAFHYMVGDRAATEAAFARAAHVVDLDLVNQRLVPNYMETRGCLADYDPASGRYTLTAGTQGGHGIRDTIATEILKIDPARIRVVTPDVGGGFGPKAFCYAEYPLAMVAAAATGRPVRWQASRTEQFLVDAQGRDNVTTGALALDADGRILAMRVGLVANMGAYLSAFAPYIPKGGVSMTTGLYDIATIFADIRGVYTNTVPVDAYRGAGRPEAAFLIERLMDVAARDLGLAPEEIRRRNFIRALPYKTPTGRHYDTGDFERHLATALERADHAGFPARLAASRRAGRLRGIGFATYVEACAFPGSEEANLSLEADGTVTLYIGTQTNGQGHATAYGQIVAAQLGIDVGRVRTVQGDTDRVRVGGGTGGSRSIPLGAASVDIAAKVLVEKIRAIAADRLEAGVADLELAGGAVRVVGTDRAMTLAEVAAAAPDADALKGYGNFEQTECTYPNGTHVAEVEIDPETGAVTLADFTAVDDFGVTVNPILLAGQVHGGIAQGAGQALCEATVYDEMGQLLTASFMDYAMPRADALPFFDTSTANVPSTTNRLGIKGAGEAGTIGATPAVANAVVDALHRGCGIRHLDMPFTPERVWRAIRTAGGAAGVDNVFVGNG
jgi:carbon-monoxide dehydrogenase large subunit